MCTRLGAVSVCLYCRGRPALHTEPPAFSWRAASAPRALRIVQILAAVTHLAPVRRAAVRDCTGRAATHAFEDRAACMTASVCGCECEEEENARTQPNHKLGPDVKYIVIWRRLWRSATGGVSHKPSRPASDSGELASPRLTAQATGGGGRAAAARCLHPMSFYMGQMPGRV